ncbi:MAG: transposase [Chitinivibrionales bacterium]|nr:transposase [Chitinivibrionales bacterium]MBD3356155.1 transposase [Chitinivibrionales bacterium]
MPNSAYAYVTNLSIQQFSCRQVVEQHQHRADRENTFDELKNQWGLAGFCSRKKNVTEFAARMTLLSYNLWSLFVRFFNIDTHQEAKTSRRELMLLPARLVRSGRRKTVALSVADAQWERIKQGYERILSRLNSIAPRLKLGTLITNLAIGFQTISPPKSAFDCGI